MRLYFEKYRFKRGIYIPLMLLFFLGLLASRRWHQIVSPQVWDEDGTQIIYSFVKLGWLTFFIPVNGMIVTVPKLISAVSLAISFVYYPMVSTVFSWLFIALVGLAITLAPTKLKGRFLCAIAVFVIPSNPEVFGLPLYTFWWASLLLFLCALWDEKQPLLGWRLLFLFLGGLSSPVIVLILPVLYLRAFLYRSLRAERVVAFIATLISVVQIISVFKEQNLLNKTKIVFLDIVPTFFGNFLLGNLHPKYFGFLFGGIVLMSLMVVWLFQKRNDIQTWILFYLLIGAIGQTATRINLAWINPSSDGPRYFFFTFIVIFWILINYLYSTRSKWLRGFIGIILIISTINAIPVWSRTHDDFHWKNHVFSSRLFPEYTIPITFDGNRTSVWFLKLPGEVCESLLEHDLLISSKEVDKYPTYPFTFLKSDGRDERLDVNVSNLISTTMIGADYDKFNLTGYRVIGSRKTSNVNAGEISLKLKRGDHLLFRTGTAGVAGSLSIVGHEQEFINEIPAMSDWVALDFSNQKLPSEFVLTIKTESENQGEWCAIALKK